MQDTKQTACYACRKPIKQKGDHKLYNCPMKTTIPKKDWFKTTGTEWWKKKSTIGMATMQDSSSVAEVSQVTAEDANKIHNVLQELLTDDQLSKAKIMGLCNANISMIQENQMEVQLIWLILADNQSTHNVFCNPEMVQNFRTADGILDLHTHGRVL